jgi:tetratricopeptide (TPR) repeat protein
VRRELDAVRVADLAGDVPAARDHAGRARAVADDLGHPGLRAEALLAFAGLEGQEPGAARAAREQALEQASIAGDRELEATATLRLLANATERADMSAIEALLPGARAAVAHGESPGLRLAFAEAEALALARLAKYELANAACERLAVLEAPPRPITTRCRCFAAIAATDQAAAAPCRDAVAAARTAYGEHHPMVVGRLSLLAKALGQVGEREEAIALDREALAIEEAAAGPYSADLAELLPSAASRLVSVGRLDEARAALERAVEIRRRVDGDRPSLRQGHAEQKLGDVFMRLHRVDEAIAHADRGLEILEANIPADHPDLAAVYATHGNINLGLDRWPIVERAMRRCDEIASKAFGERHRLRVLCSLGLAQAALAEGKPRVAADAAQTALDVGVALHLEPFNVATAHGVLGRALGEAGDRRGAREHLDVAIAMFTKVGPGAGESLAEAREQRRRF